VKRLIKTIMLSVLFVLLFSIPTLAGEPTTLGEDDFASAVDRALGLLQEKDPDGYRLVCKNVVAILQVPSLDNCSKEDCYTTGKMDAVLKFVFVSEDFMMDTRFSATSLAGVLVHEATHIYLWNEGLRNENIHEYLAYSREIETLLKLDAPKDYIESRENLRNPK